MVKRINCPFLGLECDYSVLDDNREIYFFQDNQAFDYLISQNAYDKVKADLPYNLLVNVRSLLLKSFERNLLPFLLEDRSDNLVIGNPRVQYFYLNELVNMEVSHSRKASELLQILAQKGRILGPFEGNKFKLVDIYKCKVFDESELKTWLYLLCNEGKVCSADGGFEGVMDSDPNSSYSNPLDYNFKITPLGWSFLESELFYSQNNKVFIAMSFGIENRNEIQSAITEACVECGYDATTVDLQHYQGGITDKIISMIKESKFTICDFTENKHGVYYEAGYSEGMGKTTIYTVKKGDSLSNLHFDTSHLNHIVWETVDELKVKLIDRIKAIIN